MGHSVKIRNGPTIYFPDGMNEPQIPHQIYSYKTGKTLAPGVRVVHDSDRLQSRGNRDANSSIGSLVSAANKARDKSLSPVSDSFSRPSAFTNKPQTETATFSPVTAKAGSQLRQTGRKAKALDWSKSPAITPRAPPSPRVPSSILGDPVTGASSGLPMLSVD